MYKYVHEYKVSISTYLNNGESFSNNWFILIASIFERREGLTLIASHGPASTRGDRIDIAKICIVELGIMLKPGLAQK